MAMTQDVQHAFRKLVQAASDLQEVTSTSGANEALRLRKLSIVASVIESVLLIGNRSAQTNHLLIHVLEGTGCNESLARQMGYRSCNELKYQRLRLTNMLASTFLNPDVIQTLINTESASELDGVQRYFLDLIGNSKLMKYKAGGKVYGSSS